MRSFLLYGMTVFLGIVSMDTLLALNDSASNTTENRIPVLKKSFYQMEGTKSSFNPVKDAERKATLPFQMFGSGGVGKIVDRDGKIILQSDSKNAIFGCEISPDLTRIAVNRGSRKFDIIAPKTRGVIRLPQMPPGDYVLGFSWNWIDNETLLGVSGKVVPFRDDQVGPEREEPNIERSLLYLYDIKEQKMTEVALPASAKSQVVSVNAVDQAGNIQLRPEGHERSWTDADLGWFKLSRGKK